MNDPISGASSPVSAGGRAKKVVPAIETEICIVGAGVAGSALAWYLGNQGIKVVIIERDTSEPDKFIGELLQPGGVMKLQEMGCEQALTGFDAQNIEGYALFNNGKHFSIPYPSLDGEVAMGRGFRYGKFVMSLRDQIKELPSVTLIEASVKSLIEKDSDGTITGVKYQPKGGAESTVNALLTVVCDGGFSNFRKNLNSGKQETKGFMVGLLLDGITLPYPRHGHVFLTDTSPFLAYPVSSSKTRILVDFPEASSPNQGGQAKSRLAKLGENLPESMKEAFLDAAESTKIKAMPSKMLTARPMRKNGVLMLGDALNMRHPLTGGGMTAALSDVQHLGSLLFGVNNLKESAQVNNAVNNFYDTRHQSNATINILADALYDVMSHKNLKEVCFDYLRRGDKYASGPVSFLSGVSRDKSALVREFGAVALYGAKKEMQPFSGPTSIAKSYTIIREAFNIIKPLLLNEHPAAPMRAALGMSGIIFPKNRVSVEATDPQL